MKDMRKDVPRALCRNLNIIDWTESRNIYEVGDKGEAMVLVKRVDHSTRERQKGTTPFAGYLRIRDGEIAQWEDAPRLQMSLPQPPATRP